MKKLVIHRHAKSSWKYVTSDFFRPLNARGIGDAPKMASHWGDRKAVPDIILCSPAVRTYSTAITYIQTLHWPMELLCLEDRLYESTVDKTLTLLSEHEDHDFVWIFGHNPTLNFFTDFLTGERIENIPTAGRIELNCDIEKWKDLAQGCATIASRAFPKEL